jgi:glycosyltransferase involved in cell wall biosynthesis
MKLGVLRRICAGYERALLRELSAMEGWEVRFFIGDDIPGSRLKNARDLSGLDVVKLPTRFLSVPGRVLLDHRGLGAALDDFSPDVLLCEGESNVLSNLKAMAWRRRHPEVGMVHFTIGGLPGDPRGWLRKAFLRLLHRGFDTYAAFSKFGREALISLGHPPESVFVNTFVCDTDKNLKAAADCTLTREEARVQLDLPERFTVLFVGNMESHKRVDQLLLAAEPLDPARFNVVLIGGYGHEAEYRAWAERPGMDHVFFRGAVEGDITEYYRASDALVLPGMGGVVLSEAMAHGLPTIVYRADGTELDLVLHEHTGLLLKQGTPDDIRSAIERLGRDAEETAAWGAHGQRRLAERFSTRDMAQGVMRAVDAAVAARRGPREPV